MAAEAGPAVAFLASAFQQAARVLHALAARWAVRAEQAEEFARRAREVSPVPLSLAQVEPVSEGSPAPALLQSAGAGRRAVRLVWGVVGQVSHAPIVYRAVQCGQAVRPAALSVSTLPVAGADQPAAERAARFLRVVSAPRVQISVRVVPAAFALHSS